MQHIRRAVSVGEPNISGSDSEHPASFRTCATFQLNLVKSSWNKINFSTFAAFSGGIRNGITSKLIRARQLWIIRRDSLPSVCLVDDAGRNQFGESTPLKCISNKTFFMSSLSIAINLSTSTHVHCSVRGVNCWFQFDLINESLFCCC